MPHYRNNSNTRYTRRSPRSALRKRFGSVYMSKFERCVSRVKSRSGRKYNPFAVCHSSLQGRTRQGRSRSGNKVRSNFRSINKPRTSRLGKSHSRAFNKTKNNRSGRRRKSNLNNKARNIQW